MIVFLKIMCIQSYKAKYLIENEGVPTSGGLLKSQMNKTAVVKVVEIAEEEMKERLLKPILKIVNINLIGAVVVQKLMELYLLNRQYV